MIVIGSFLCVVDLFLTARACVLWWTNSPSHHLCCLQCISGPHLHPHCHCLHTHRRPEPLIPVGFTLVTQGFFLWTLFCMCVWESFPVVTGSLTGSVWIQTWICGQHTHCDTNAFFNWFELMLHSWILHFCFELMLHTQTPPPVLWLTVTRKHLIGPLLDLHLKVSCNLKFVCQWVTSLKAPC